MHFTEKEIKLKDKRTCLLRSPDERDAEAMISYLSHFVKTGNPNGPGLTIWEPAGGETIRFMHFGDKDDGMISPDTSLLSKNEATRSPFPYAMSIQVNPTSSGKG